MEDESCIDNGYHGKKRSFRRVIMLSLWVTILAVGLSACGGGDSNNSGSGSDKNNNWDTMVWDTGSWD